MNADNPRTTGRAVGVYFLCSIGVSFVVSILNVVMFEGGTATGLLLLVPGIACARWWKLNLAVQAQDLAKICVLSGLSLFLLAAIFNSLVQPGLLEAYANVAGMQSGILWSLRAIASTLLATTVIPLAGIAGCIYAMYLIVRQVKSRPEA